MASARSARRKPWAAWPPKRPNRTADLSAPRSLLPVPRFSISGVAPAEILGSVSPLLFMSAQIENTVIVGTGCAGLTAAIYTGPANLTPPALDAILPARQLPPTSDVDNIP